MANTCNFIQVNTGTSCTSDFAGTGNYMFLARLGEKLRASIVEDEAKNRASFADAEELAKAKFYKVGLKKKVNKIDYKNNPNGRGFMSTANTQVDKDLDNWSANAKIMNNTGDWVVLIPTGKKNEFYFLGSAAYDNEVEIAGTTGDSPESDKGDTLTITSGPHEWEYLKIEGTMTEKVASAGGASEGYFTFSQAGA